MNADADAEPAGWGGEPAGGPHGAPPPGDAQAPSEEELRRAYEAELGRVSTTDMMAQTVISLLNLAARRLGPAPSGGPQADEAGQPGPGAATGRDLEQVRDAIDGVRALMGILERRIAGELGPLREALSQLQMAYAREVQAPSQARPPTGGQQGGGGDAPQGPGGPGGGASGQGSSSEGEQAPPAGRRPGPAESSGRLWVPGG
jgi:hypothetical protein